MSERQEAKEPDPLTKAGMNSLRTSVDVLEAVIESGRLAVSELEAGLKRADVGEAGQLRVVAESVARGYFTFFREMTRTARDLADVYRSESGTLVRKPRSEEATGSDATPSGPDQSSPDEMTPPAQREGGGDQFRSDLTTEFSHLAERVFDILRRGAGWRG